MRRAHAALAVLLVIGARASRAQERAGFVTVRGSDTVAAESFTRTAGNIDGILAVRSPRASLTYYQARLRYDSTIVRLDMVTRVPGEPDSTEEKAVMQFGVDSALIVLTHRGSTRSFHVPVQLAVPWVEASIALYEPMFRRAQRIREDTTQLNLLPFIAPALPALLRRMESRLYELRFAGGVFRVETDEIGRVLRWTRQEPAGQTRAERRTGIHVEAIAESFRRRERAGIKDRGPP